MGGTAAGLTAEPVELYGYDCETKLRVAAPALIQLDGQWVAMAKIRKDRVTLVYPDHSRRKTTIEEIWRTLTRTAVEPHRESIDKLLEGCGIAQGRRERAFE